MLLMMLTTFAGGSVASCPPPNTRAINLNIGLLNCIKPAYDSSILWDAKNFPNVLRYKNVSLSQDNRTWKKTDRFMVMCGRDRAVAVLQQQSLGTQAGMGRWFCWWTSWQDTPPQNVANGRAWKAEKSSVIKKNMIKRKPVKGENAERRQELTAKQSTSITI